MISQTTRFKSSSTTVLLRCPKDLYESCGKSKQSTKRQSSSKSKRVAPSPSNRHRHTVKDQNHDPYLLKRPVAIQQPLESITALRRKLKNLEFLESCLYAEIQKLEVSGSEPAQSSVKYQQSVTDYDTVISNSDQLAANIRVSEDRLKQYREGLAMVKADVESSYLQRAELLLQLEDSEQILTAYAEQFEEENLLVLKEIDIQDQLQHVEHNKKSITAELELVELQQRKLDKDHESQRNQYFKQKANQLRVDLLEQEEVVNQMAKQHSKSTLREIVCSFYSILKSKTKSSEDGLDVWLCRNQLVERFKQFIHERNDPMKSELSSAFKKYIDILSKVEIIYRKMENSHLEQSMAKFKTEESELMSQYNYWVNNQQRLITQQESNRIKIRELLAQEKLYKLYTVDSNNSKILAGTVQKLTNEQEKRIANIKFHKKRIPQLKASVRGKVPREEHIDYIGELQTRIKDLELELSRLRAQYLKCDRMRRQKESQFRSVKLSRMPGKKHQDIEAITILYKKIERIRDKKIILRNQIAQIQNEMGDCITPKANTQTTTSKCHSHSRQQTTPSNLATSQSLFKRLKTDHHPLEQTIQKLQRLKDSITERAPMTAVYSRILKF